MNEDTNFFGFDLKPQQKQAFSNLISFAKGTSDRVFLLKGYAGTGKTTLMSGLLKWLNKNDMHASVLASTGRAAKIISDKTDTPARTVHSQIYKFRDLNEDLDRISQNIEHAVDSTGQLSLLFDMVPLESATESRLYIIDESSMISDQIEKNTSFARFGTGELLGDLFEYDPVGRFIFVGDPGQLPPVGQAISPALNKSYIEEKYQCSVFEIELTEIVRQTESNGIIVASMLLRKLYASNPPVKYASFPLKNQSNIILHNSHIELLNEYIDRIKRFGLEYATLLCISNRLCDHFNRNVRMALGKISNRLDVGDLLMVTQNNYLTDLVNGDLVVVNQIGIREYRCGLSFLKVEVKELVSNSLHRILLIEDVLYSNATNLDQNQHRFLFVDYYKRMQKLGIKQKDKVFKENMLKDPYLNALRAVYGFALTCHKSQGGEWEEVFLYMDTKIQGVPRPYVYQWVYTAVTRARKTLHIVNDIFLR